MITLYGADPNGKGGIATYANTLLKHLPNSACVPYKKIEFVRNGKRHFGYISNFAFQFTYNIKSDIIHSLSSANFHYKSNVSTIHDLFFDSKNYERSVKLFLSPAIIKWKLGKLKIIFVSKLGQNQFKQIYHSIKDTYVIPMGIDFNYIDSLKFINPFTTENNIVFAGGVDFKRRNQEYIIKKLLNTDYNLYIVGYGLVDILKEKYKKYTNMHFVKSPSDSEFYSYLNYSDLNVYNTVGEGFGYIIYESLYLGKKMLINENEDNILLFDDYVDYYTDKNFYSKIEDNLDKHVNKREKLLDQFSVKKMIEKTLDVYSTVR